MFVAVLSSGDFSFSGESKGMSVGGSQTSSETGKILSFTRKFIDCFIGHAHLDSPRTLACKVTFVYVFALKPSIKNPNS